MCASRGYCGTAARGHVFLLQARVELDVVGRMCIHLDVVGQVGYGAAAMQLCDR